MREGEPQVRVVVAGEFLEDGDLGLTFPDRRPELDPETLFKVEAKAVETELTRLMDMGVPQHPSDQDLSGVETLSTKFVLDSRWREEKWNRRARLAARDFAWLDPNRTDTFAPASGQSLLRIIPALAQVRGWKLATLDVKDAYLMCPQPKHIKVILDKQVSEALNMPRDWILGKLLPGQREGAAEWFQHLKGTLLEAGLKQCPEAPTMWSNDTHTLAVLIHADDLIITGMDEAMDELLNKLKEK